MLDVGVPVSESEEIESDVAHTGSCPIFIDRMTEVTENKR